VALGKPFAESPMNSSRQRPFADKRCADRPLPRATLGKGFAESKTAFAERLRLSAKTLYAVVP